MGDAPFRLCKGPANSNSRTQATAHETAPSLSLPRLPRPAFIAPLFSLPELKLPLNLLMASESQATGSPFHSWLMQRFISQPCADMHRVLQKHCVSTETKTTSCNLKAALNYEHVYGWISFWGTPKWIKMVNFLLVPLKPTRRGYGQKTHTHTHPVRAESSWPSHPYDEWPGSQLLHDVHEAGAVACLQRSLRLPANYFDFVSPSTLFCGMF